MRQDWDNVTLGEAVTLQRGFDLSHDEFDGGRFPVVSSGGIIGHHSVAMAHGPGVVIGRTGTLDSVFYLTSDYWPHNTTLWVKDFHGNVPRFIYYFLRGLSLAYMNVGSANPTLNRNHLHELTVRLPRVPYQRAIARVLGSLDDKIELNRRMNQTLEDICRALFKFWFVDFGPVRAKQEGRWKKGESLPGMPADMWDLWPSEFEESEIGEIPTGWQILQASEVVEVSGGSTPSTSEAAYWKEGTHAWATPKDLAPLRTPVLLRTERKITEAGLSTISSGLLPTGTVLLSSRAPIGYLAISEIPVAVNQGFIAIQCNKGVSSQYMLRWAESNLEEIKSVANGTTFLEVNKQNFRLLPILVPDKAILGVFDAFASRLYRTEVNNERECGTLSSLRDALLPKLLSGEIRVKADE